MKDSFIRETEGHLSTELGQSKPERLVFEKKGWRGKPECWRTPRWTGTSWDESSGRDGVAGNSLSMQGDS